MKFYIGTKLVAAEPATRYWLKCDKSVIVAHDEDKPQIIDSAIGLEEGYKVRYADGYESWSPKEVFEEAYREVEGLNFGLALEAAKAGYRIARRGWNGQRMYVFLAKEPDFNTDADLSEFDDAWLESVDCLALRTAQGCVQLGWLASQTDMLSDDWYIVDEIYTEG